MFRIAVQGNCQGEILAKALVEMAKNQRVPVEVLFLRNYDAGADTLVSEDPEAQAFLQASDAFLEQVVDNAPQIGSYVAARALRIRYPSAQMNWLWPSTTQDHPLRPSPVADHLRTLFPLEACDSTIHPFIPARRARAGLRYRSAVRHYADAHPTASMGRRLIGTGGLHIMAALSAIRRETPVEREQRYAEALEAYFTKAVPRPAMLDRLYELNRDRIIASDQESDFAIWPEIERDFRDRRLFWHRSHPVWEFQRSLVARIARALPIGLSEQAIESGLDRIGANSPLEDVHAPIHPAIARHFGLKWCDESMRFRINHVEGWMTHRDFVARYLRFDYDEAAYRGHWLATTGTSAEALAAGEGFLRDALERHPENSALSFRLGVNLVQQNGERLAEALRHMENAAADPAMADDPRAATWLGNTHGRMGNRQAAVEALRRVLRVRNVPSVRMQVARQLSAMGHESDAILEMGIAIGHDPFNAQWHAELGRAYLRTGDKARALACFETVLDFDRSNREAWADYLQVKAERDGFPAVKPELDELALTSADPRRLLRLGGRASLAVGDMAEAERAYRLLVETAPDDANGWFGLGSALRKAPAAALEAFGEAWRREPENPGILFATGRALSDVGRLSEALGLLDRAIALTPGNAGFREQRARVAGLLGLPDDPAGHPRPIDGLAMFAASLGARAGSAPVAEDLPEPAAVEQMFAMRPKTALGHLLAWIRRCLMAMTGSRTAFGQGR